MSILGIMDLANSFNRTLSLAGPRIPMVFSCTQWANENQQPLPLRINPHAITFKQGKRITNRKSQGGTAFFHWTDDNGQNNDVLEMQFKGRTGNIKARNDPPTASKLGNTLGQVANWISGTNPETGSPPVTDASAKHLSWARLYTLTRLPVIDRVRKTQNVFWIDYTSPLFPRTIQFQGFYNAVLDFSEVAESPNSSDWSFNFTVVNTWPSLDEITLYLTDVLNNPGKLEEILRRESALTAQMQQTRNNLNKSSFG